MKFVLMMLTLISFASGHTSASLGHRQDNSQIGGRITDLFGYPLQGAEVRLLAYSPGKETQVSLEPKSIVRTVTDRQGEYRLMGLTSGSYVILVELQGFPLTQSEPIYLARGANLLLDLGLPVGYITPVPSMEITGIVQQADKSPIHDATVTVVSAYNLQVFKQARSNKEGHFKIPVNAPGQYLVYAAKGGFALSSATVDIKAGDHRYVELTLAPSQGTRTG